jgi:alkylhydroperoxidase/carboxymuconolactone decarboxylase family protein YurZ
MEDRRDTWIQRGKATRERLFGPDIGNRKAAAQLIPELGELSDEANWGHIWSRPGLELRTRSLCIISALLALERYKYAAIHIRGARRLGVTKAELAEVVAQLTFYAGLPVVHEGLALVDTIFAEEATER